jgi:hypothetical protein
VKKSGLHIISSVFLISSLLFTQLAVNFFHRNHNVHEIKAAASKPNATPEWHKHDEHCKLCSIDFFNHSFDNPPVILFSVFTDATQYGFCQFSSHSVSLTYFKGRAPPLA